MNVILFSLYYGKLRASVLLRIHQTANPLNLKWRWSHWQDKNRRQRIRIL